MNHHPAAPGGPAVRPLTRADLPAAKAVIASVDLFPPEMLDDMTAAYLDAPGAAEHWLTLDDGEPLAIAYLAPERMTVGTWNMLLIAVRSDCQGRGYGTLLTRHAEQLLAGLGTRILLVETSGLPEFEPTRRFYDRLGYRREATIRDFYAAGEDKIVFWKSLEDG